MEYSTGNSFPNLQGGDMRSMIACLIAVLAYSTALSDSVTALKATDNTCQVFTPPDDTTLANNVQISVRELQCLGVEVKVLEPWMAVNVYETGTAEAQHVSISKHSLGFLIHLAGFLRSKNYSAESPILLSIDSQVLADSHGKELLISKEPNEPTDSRLLLRRPRNQDVLFILELHRHQKLLQYTNESGAFRVVPLSKPPYEHAFVNRFHPPTVVSLVQ